MSETSPPLRILYPESLARDAALAEFEPLLAQAGAPIAGNFFSNFPGTLRQTCEQHPDATLLIIPPALRAVHGLFPEIHRSTISDACVFVGSEEISLWSMGAPEIAAGWDAGNWRWPIAARCTVWQQTLANSGPFWPGAAVVASVRSQADLAIVSVPALQAAPGPVPGLVPASGRNQRDELASRLQACLSCRREGQKSAIDWTAVQAGLCLKHDFMETSHELSQSIEHQGRHRNGDYWHGILHRREPDYSNAKYWFRQVKIHPVFTELLPWAQARLATLGASGARWNAQICGSQWNPFAFVDLCEQCATAEPSGSPLTAAAQAIQLREMEFLVQQSFQDACQ